MAHWTEGLTREQIRDAEMARGTEVIAEKGALQDLLAQQFDPDYKHTKKNEYNQRLAEMNKNREDFK